MIGITTVNWHGFEATLHLVSEILESDYQDIYLIVVNNSSDEIEKFDRNELFKDLRIKVIHSPKNIGYTGGLNLGLKILLPNERITHFLLLNNDVDIDPDFIQRMIKEGADSNKIYAPVILYQNTELVQNTGGNIHIWLGGGINLNNNIPISKIRKRNPDYLSGCILFMHRNIIEKVGLFDELFGSYCEDVDYCFRSQSHGIGLEILWGIRARHFHSHSTIGNTDLKVYLLNRNQILLAKKHLPPLQKELFIAAAIIRGGIQNLFKNQFRPYLRGVIEGLSL